MANWLEDEERNQAVRLQNQAVRLQSDLLQYQLRVQREEDVLKRLSTFHTLCGRVNGVRPGSLSIDRLNAEGPIHQISTPFNHGQRLYGKRRGIRISCASQDLTSIDVVIIELFGTGYIEGPDTGQNNIVVVRKTCCLQDLSEWKEHQILHAIQWLINEAETVKDSLPGREIMNAEGRLVIRLSTRAYEGPNSVQVIVDGNPVGNVSYYDRTNFGMEGRAFDLGVGGHQLTVSGGGSSRTVTIHLVAEHVTLYEMCFGGFWSGIELKQV